MDVHEELGDDLVPIVVLTMIMMAVSFNSKEKLK